MFQIAREVSAKIRAGCIYLLDFILVEANAIKPTNACQTETQGHDEQECGGGMPFQHSRNRARLVFGRRVPSLLVGLTPAKNFDGI